MLIHLTTAFNHAAGGGWDVVRLFVEHLAENRPVTLGLVLNTTWHLTRDTHTYARIYAAARHYATDALHLDFVSAVRLGRGCGRLPARSEFEQQFLVWWFASRPREHFTYESDVPEMLVMRAVVGESWKAPGIRRTLRNRLCWLLERCGRSYQVIP